MSLDTVLKIGKIYRNSLEYGLDEHRYINRITTDIGSFTKNKDENGIPIQTVIYNIPVVKDSSLNWVLQIDNISVIDLIDEDRIKSLRYLNYKTSDKDSSKKYLFGDIIYSTFKKDGKIVEAGSYRLGGDSSFLRGKDEMSGIDNNDIISFRASFEKNISNLESLLTSVPAAALHFDFQGQQWFELEGVMSAINLKLVREFAVEGTLPNGRNVVSLSKTIFKTIKSPLYNREKNSFADPDGIGGCVPGFSNTSGYKVRHFDSVEEIIDLFYAINTAEKKFARRIKDVGILALPYAENITARQLNVFFGNEVAYDEAEEKLIQEQKDADTGDYDPLFGKMLDNEFNPDVSFDIIFMKPPGMSTPSIDLVEISSIRKSFLRDVHENIYKKKSHWEKLANEKMPGLKKPIRFNVVGCFQNLLDNRTKDQKKYQSHLLKVLPLIYGDNYYHDPVLLPLLIEQTEYGVRNGGTSFNILKYSYYFLTSIQKYGENTMNNITNSLSYQMGHSLGIMSKPFASWRENCPIKSFEKSYVGNLSRRVLSTTDVVVFANFLNEKLTIHDQNYPEQRESFLQLMKVLKNLESDSKEKYDRNACALGFFEGYNSQQKETEK